MRLVTLSLGVLALGGALCAETASAGNIYGVAYVGLRGSYVMTEDGETRSDSASGLYDYDESYDDGYAVGVEMGWVLGNDFRFAIEGEHRHAEIGNVTIVRDDSLPPVFPVLPPPPYAPGTVVNAGGDVSITSAMANLFYDFNMLDAPFVPFIGFGVGGSYIDYAITDPNSSITFQGSDTTWVLTYQFMAGVAFPVGESMTMSIGYKYLRTDDFNYLNSFDETMRTNIVQQSVDVGLQFIL
ncbi:MAG: outer membrane protein [Micropepsaceae bacterium]